MVTHSYGLLRVVTRGKRWLLGGNGWVGITSNELLRSKRGGWAVSSRTKKGGGGLKQANIHP